MNILITGGASGLGLSLTEIFLENGHKVFFTYYNSKATALEIEEKYENAKGYQLDFGNQEEVDEFIKNIPLFDLDVLVNNAFSGPFLETHFHKKNGKDFVLDFRRNLLPTITITQEVIKVLRKKKAGKIISVLTAGLENKPPIGGSQYIAGKAYLRSLVKSWAVENIKFGISSNSVSPSLMRTELTKDLDERLIAHIEENHPLKKLVSREEVAESVYALFLMPTHVNGVDLLINAGENLR